MKKCDYHVHYHLDECASDDMKLQNIEREAIKLGLDEICVLKHYSKLLPNGLDSWVYWKKIKPEQFDFFLDDINKFKKVSKINILSGVETEIIDDSGNINILSEDSEKLDVLVLSVHWLPKLSVVNVDTKLRPHGFDKSPEDIVDEWFNQLKKVKTEDIVANFISAYVKTVEKNTNPLILGHMYDGLYPLRGYQIPVDKIPKDKLTDLFRPLFKVCSERNVLWELLPEPVKFPEILHKANEYGCKFTATADAHSLYKPNDGMNFTRHNEAEDYIKSLALNKGVIRK